MEVRPGYKQTEVGVIPEDWDVKPLVVIADKIMVGIASAATHAYRVKGIPMFRNQNIKAGYLDDSDLLFVAPEYEVAFKNKRLRGGDLLTMRTGYPGVTAIVPPRYDSAQSFTTLITRPKQNEAESAYLCHFINSEIGQLFFTQSQIGGAQKNVNAGTLRQMPVPLPKIPEQRAIATALSDVDALLGALDRLIAKKRDLKQAAMQQLLSGQTRLPGFHGKWEVKRLTSIAELESGHTPSKRQPSYWGGGIPWVSLHDTDGLAGREIFNTVQTITEAGLNHSSARMLPKGTVVFSRTATVGKSTVLGRDMATSQDFANYICGPQLQNHFLVYLFRSMGRTWKSLMAGSIHNTIYMPVFKALEITIPSLPEQTAITKVLTDMDEELAALEQRWEKTRALKQGMMQELLTGRTRLVAPSGTTA